jgi:hypothetical protein
MELLSTYTYEANLLNILNNIIGDDNFHSTFYLRHSRKRGARGHFKGTAGVNASNFFMDLYSGALNVGTPAADARVITDQSAIERRRSVSGSTVPVKPYEEGLDPGVIRAFAELAEITGANISWMAVEQNTIAAVSDSFGGTADWSKGEAWDSDEHKDAVPLELAPRVRAPPEWRENLARIKRPVAAARGEPLSADTTQ